MPTGGEDALFKDDHYEVYKKETQPAAPLTEGFSKVTNNDQFYDAQSSIPSAASSVRLAFARLSKAFSMLLSAQFRPPVCIAVLLPHPDPPRAASPGRLSALHPFTYVSARHAAAVAPQCRHLHPLRAGRQTLD